ncbi:VOC family protein [Altererythrobacter sp. GH1-8]|uniref:VOC family protein n=1 Tax=Altererythrobacter sp. GH1-8 TaxID=3349333 RepID=UPI00374DE793
MQSGRLLKAAIGGLALIAAPAPPALADETPQRASEFGAAPWTEAVVSVTDLDASSAWLIEDGGWRVVAEGPVHRGELDYWRLPAAVTAQFRKICAAEADTGCIRFVRFDGVEDQRPIRLTARPWDTGGIFSIMLRSEDTQALYDAAIARGWWAESEPYRFSFGGSDLVNVVVQGPHGVNYALYQREAPPFTGFPIGRLSQAFNTMRMVKDQPASLAFYRDILGLKVLFDYPFTDPQPRSNNFSVPANLATTLVRRAAVVQPDLPGETGRIEVMQFEGFTGRDLSAYASPPNLGIISVRYPVERLGDYYSFLQQQGVGFAYAADQVTIPALGKVDIIAVRDPDGNLTEFYHAY